MIATLEELQTALRVIEGITVMAWRHDAQEICGGVQVVHGCIASAIAKKTAEVIEHDQHNAETPSAPE